MLTTLRCDEAHAASVLVLRCFCVAAFAAGNVAFLLCGRQGTQASVQEQQLRQTPQQLEAGVSER
ncbi:hypothetical protein CCHR01_09325 [Colletotrichum chrysophilum]|uniref:Uncharacterized protein n=1 Tax=Colletotrichum chrysophilum TaxID=1836956 RepID=A0AAD9EHU7_9PEZI|nr:hypothetical protein K456DRAFT_56516 [Colletotrichum gloeosporioides 23]KAK1848012.1 hypothetical protein CCHR01_09325 [Colletotrichum chrysophilum]